MFGMQGDDDPIRKLYARIMNDYSQQYNVWEISKNMMNNLSPVSFRKGYKAMDATSTLLMSVIMAEVFNDPDALTALGNYRGIAETQRSIPLISSYRDLEVFLRKTEDSTLQDYLLFRGFN